MRYTDHLLHLKFIFCITNSQEESSKIFYSFFIGKVCKFFSYFRN